MQSARHRHILCRATPPRIARASTFWSKRERSRTVATVDGGGGGRLLPSLWALAGLMEMTFAMAADRSAIS